MSAAGLLGPNLVTVEVSQLATLVKVKAQGENPAGVTHCLKRLGVAAVVKLALFKMLW